MIDKNKFEFFVLKFLQKFFMLIGLKAGRRIAVSLSYLLYYVIPLRKSVVKKNLHLAFPEKSEKEIKRLAFENLRSSMITFIEVLTLPKFDEKSLEELFVPSDMAEFFSRYTKKTGALLMTAHFGNWEYIAVWVGLCLDVPFNVLIKRMRNPYATKLLRKNRTRYGNIEIPVGNSVKTLIEKLKMKEAVGIVGDQRGKREGPRVRFFNRDTAIYTGTAMMAIKMNVPVLFVLSVRQKDYKYKLIYKEIKYDDLEGTVDEKVLALTQRYMTMVEETVREHPEQWFWMHNIWKY
ncbi:MAG: hypothetical protein GXO87_02525 [Chlorobi bacterium]|nr:hypothetical protein [Chlorobiota bacterium]